MNSSADVGNEAKKSKVMFHEAEKDSMFIKAARLATMAVDENDIGLSCFVVVFIFLVYSFSPTVPRKQMETRQAK